MPRGVRPLRDVLCWGSSALVHGALLLVLACFVHAGADADLFRFLEARLGETEADRDLVPVDLAKQPVTDLDKPDSTATTSSSQTSSVAMESTVSPIGSPRQSLSPLQSGRAMMESQPVGWTHSLTLNRNAVNQYLIAERVAQQEAERGKGAGSNETGTGDGGSHGFFGNKPEGKRVIFVVDNSGSMNAQHSPRLTRFMRLQVELLNSLNHMTAEQEFFVFFFARDPLAMPAAGPLRATEENKLACGEWITGVIAEGGPTDPRRAIQLALKMKPDTIYFLTDGSFDRQVIQSLQMISSPVSKIHTFAFGNIEGEPILQAVAKNNRGNYTFVP